MRWIARLAQRLRPAAPADARHRLGRRGEAIAARYLRRLGMRIVARGYRTPVGELDLICRDAGTLVFVEVKTRSDRVFAEPEDSITSSKMRKLSRAAAWYVHSKRLEHVPLRFDVMTITYAGNPDVPPQVRHHAAAFVPRA